MESCDSKRKYSEDSLPVLDNLINTEDIMLNMKKTESMRCDVCNKRNETLVRREEIAWQREDVIHAREKELREMELLLEEKLVEVHKKEKLLRLEEEKLQSLGRASPAARESKHRGSATSSGEESASACASPRIENELQRRSSELAEKERVLREQENLVSERTRNVEKREQAVLLKEKLLSGAVIQDMESQLAAERNKSLENREQIVKNLEKVLEAKLEVVSQKKKSLDEREKGLTMKDRALAEAAETLSRKGLAIDDREKELARKENGFLKEMFDFASSERLKEAGEVVGVDNEAFERFDKIVNSKLLSFQQRENVISRRELILEEKGKKFAEAKELMKSEEKDMLVARETLEKEKGILKERQKLLERYEGESKRLTEGAHVDKSYKSMFFDNNMVMGPWESPLSDQGVDDGKKDASPVLETDKLAVGHRAVPDGMGTPNRNENGPQLGGRFDWRVREISGEEFFQFYEKEKEELKLELMRKEADGLVIEKSEPSNAQEAAMTPQVEDFFNKLTASQKTDGIESEGMKNFTTCDEVESEIPQSTPPSNDDTKETGRTTGKTLSARSAETAENEDRKKGSSSLQDQKIQKANSGNILVQEDTAFRNRCAEAIDRGSLNRASRESLSHSPSPEKNASEKKYGADCNGEVTNGKVSPGKQQGDCSSTKGSPGSARSPTSPPATPRTTPAATPDATRVSVKEGEACGSGSPDRSFRPSCSPSSPLAKQSSMQSPTQSPTQSPKQTPVLAAIKSAMPPTAGQVRSTPTSPRSPYSPGSAVSPANDRRSPGASMSKRPPRDALLKAIASENFLETVQLLDSHNMSLELRDKTGRSAFLLAVQSGNVDLVKRLVAMGADYRACDYDGCSALHIAVSSNSSDMLVFLLKKGLDARLTDNNGTTAEEMARKLGYTSLQEIIENFGIVQN